MGAEKYKSLRVVNNGLSPTEWDLALYRLCKYSRCICRGDSIFLNVFMSTTKRAYSVDLGADTTEFQAMKHSVIHYLGDFAQRVKIIEIG